MTYQVIEYLGPSRDREWFALGRLVVACVVNILYVASTVVARFDATMARLSTCASLAFILAMLLVIAVILYGPDGRPAKEV